MRVCFSAEVVVPTHKIRSLTLTLLGLILRKLKLDELIVSFFMK